MIISPSGLWLPELRELCSNVLVSMFCFPAGWSCGCCSSGQAECEADETERQTGQIPGLVQRWALQARSLQILSRWHYPKTKVQGYDLPKLLCVLGFWGQAFCHFPLSAAQPLPLPGNLQGPVSGRGSLTPGIRIGYLAIVTVKRTLCTFCWFVMLQ